MAFADFGSFVAADFILFSYRSDSRTRLNERFRGYDKIGYMCNYPKCLKRAAFENGRCLKHAMSKVRCSAIKRDGRRCNYLTDGSFCGVHTRSRALALPKTISPKAGRKVVVEVKVVVR